MQLITFDGYGVSGHPNHRAVSAGVAVALRSRKLTCVRPVSLYILVSTGAIAAQVGTVSGLERHATAQDSTAMWRKFLGPVDIPLSIAGVMRCRRASCYIGGGPSVAWLAMKAHQSQFVWYRRLYVLFSRYVYVNTLLKSPD